MILVVQISKTRRVIAHHGGSGGTGDKFCPLSPSGPAMWGLSLLHIGVLCGRLHM